MKFDISAIGTEHIYMTLIGYSIVFMALVALYLIFDNLPKVLLFLNGLFEKKTVEQKPAVSSKHNLSGAVNAAIATALHLYFDELHDEEITKLTINKVSRNYSPWSSKIYSVMQSHLQPQTNKFSKK
ncbi:OadG family protein [Chondrinema litorale]|uniref:OadG family protein n=1 Tax=Chondrinema litorale TaxID=2994555 RepID=UPI00254380A4|nr:OadG family protein [Chondrinema litorale]UZR92854.1 OadG family protein [Chondrinema litorale]